ncbi:MAG: hypothetical protein R3C32_14735 [Chloroflexota bacterium]
MGVRPWSRTRWSAWRSGQRRYADALARHLAVIEREFGRRLTAAQHHAVADALWAWWHDADPPAVPEPAG